MFVIDTEYSDIYVLNGDNIEMTADEFEASADELESDGYVEFDDDEDAQFMTFPNMTEFNSKCLKLYIKYK